MVRTVLPAAALLAALLASYQLGSRARPALAVGGLIVVALAVTLGPLLTRHGAAATTSGIVFFELLLVVAPASLGVLQRGRRQLADQVRRSAETAHPDEGVAAGPRAFAAELDGSLSAALDQLDETGTLDSLEAVIELEQVARAILERMRVVAHGLLAGEPQADRPPTVPELQARVDAIVGEADLGVDERLARRSLVSATGIDLTLAVVAVLLGLAAALGTHSAAEAVLAAGTALPVALARRRPFLAAVVSLAALIGLTALTPDHDALSGPASVALQLIFPFVAGGLRPIRNAFGLLTLCLGVTVVLPVLTSGSYPTGEVAGALAAEIGCWTGGFALRRGQGWLHQVVEGVGQRQDRAQADLAEARTAQRTALARDLHDAVAHSMTIVVLHAAAARRAWDDWTQREVHLLVLRETLDNPMSELRELVHRLEGERALADSGAGRVAASVGELCDRAAQAGLRVELEPEQAAAMEAAGELGGRVVQEALTNAARYAPGSQVRISVSRVGSDIQVEILNGPACGTPLEALGAGLGLAGLSKRLADVGGTLSTSATPHGGFRLCASIPDEVGAR